MIYVSSKTEQISFPLGGIGTGCIGLAGNGRLVDFEIFNRPNKKSVNGYSGFAIKAEQHGQVVDARMLCSGFPPPYLGERLDTKNKNAGFGFGPAEKTLAGFPHFQSSTFDGKFPIAEITYKDEVFPGNVKTTAFNPFIPHDDENSGLPAAFFDVEITNTANEDTDYIICFFFGSPFTIGQSSNTHSSHMRGNFVTISSTDITLPLEKQGDITIATDSSDVSYQEYWYRGAWLDNIEVFWEDFTACGMPQNRKYTNEAIPNGANDDTACIFARVSLKASESGNLRFVVSWNFPYMYNFWNPEKDGHKTYWKNYYATRLESSLETAQYALSNWDKLQHYTELFTHTIHGSTLPLEVKDAVTANLSVLKSPTVLRLTDGTFYGFEGCLEHEGSCEGSCSHVWNYAYALPFLFPKLERSMREADFLYNQRHDGRMSFRLSLPLGREPADFSACVDGQMGGIIKTYREWKISGDDNWLKKVWPAAKKSLEYAWVETNEDKWDIHKTGVIWGRQHHTLDMELFCPNSWLTGFYLAALSAATQIANYLGEDSTDYNEMFLRGCNWVKTNLFNGDYFEQKIDLSDIEILKQFEESVSITGQRMEAYWNLEANEIKYQIAKGCAIDQVVAQWHANLCGLGEIFETAQVKAALQALYRNNFKSMLDVVNPWRNFAVNDEKGLLICTWARGEKPIVPLTYSTECMTGFEYQAACHMLQIGLVEEGLAIVRAVRNRYDGFKRNPWNEMECGSNYARSMASYSLLLTLSGFTYDMTKRHIGFSPLLPKDDFKCFWSVATSWGTVEVSSQSVALTLLYGDLTLWSFELQKDFTVKEFKKNTTGLTFKQCETVIYFEELTLKEGDTIIIKS